jgi:hypothetical protein
MSVAVEGGNGAPTIENDGRTGITADDFRPELESPGARPSKPVTCSIELIKLEGDTPSPDCDVLHKITLISSCTVFIAIEFYLLCSNRWFLSSDITSAY